MTTEATYAGLTIEINNDINSMADWVIGSEDDGTVDFDATCEVYAGLMSDNLKDWFPGVDVHFRFTNGGGRTVVYGVGDGDVWIEQDDLAVAIEHVMDRICPQGDPGTFIVTTEGS